MVLGDDVPHPLGQLIPVRQGHAVFHMADDDSRALLGIQLIMGVTDMHLVFLEHHGARQLADIVIIRRHPCQKRIAAHGVRRRFRQVGRHDAVMIGSRRLDHQPL